MNESKINISVLIENDQKFTGSFIIKQKVQVIVNKVIAEFSISSENRELRREDGTPILDYGKTIEEIGIYENETLRYFVKSDKPDRDKRFA